MDAEQPAQQAFSDKGFLPVSAELHKHHSLHIWTTSLLTFNAVILTGSPPGPFTPGSPLAPHSPLVPLGPLLPRSPTSPWGKKRNN